MSDEIRIVSLELENYRPYHGKHKINFSSRDEGFTIIFGKNGEGKSNLLNAISWCLYHEEPHGMGKDSPMHKSKNKSLSIINNRYIIDLDEGKMATTTVKILLEKGDTVYSISRVLEVIKHKLEYEELSGGEKSLLVTKYASDKVPNGCEIINETDDVVVKKKGPGEHDFHADSKGHPDTIIKEILPQGLSKYFLLDGEFLEGFWQNSDVIKNGVEQISQLHLLSSLMEHIDKMRIPKKGIGGDIDQLTTKIQTLAWYEQSIDETGNKIFSEEIRWKKNLDDEDRYYHATGNPRIKDLKDDIKDMELRINEFSKLLSNINIPNVQLLKQNYDGKQKDYGDEVKRMNSLGKKYRYNLITKSPYVFLKKAIENSVSIIEEVMNLGNLPVKQRRQFADDLLTRGTCVCGENLKSKIVNKHETNPRRKSIEDFKNTLTGKDDLDAAVEMRYDFTHEFVKNYDIFLKIHFDDPRVDFTNSESKCNSLNFELKSISDKLLMIGDDTTSALIREQTDLLDQISSKRDLITEIKVILAKKASLRGELKIQWDKASKKNIKAKKLSHEIKIWDMIYEHINKIYDELKIGIRHDVQNNTWNNFKELLANPSEFEAFKIESDYSAYLLDKYNMNKIRDLSAGQSLILTLAFVAALRGPTGYKFPLVVDSPIGKIDSANRYNIATRLPDHLPNEQLTLLVTDTEYTGNLPLDPDYPELTTTPFGKLLSDKIPLKHFKIYKEKNGKNVGNSTIKSAKLVYDEDKKGYMVVISDV